MNLDKLNNNAVVLLSGGQDSMTCLFWALDRFDNVSAIGFDYSQKHKVELKAAQEVADKMDVDYTIHRIHSLATLRDSALVDTNQEVSDKHPSNENLPASFVPARNALFLTIGHAYAQKIGADNIVGGMCETDYSGYPDCRRNFIDGMQSTLNLGYETNIRILTPLMYIDKAQTFKLAEDLFCLDAILEHSHTCYNGVRDVKHVWGYGCGECPACELRKKGYLKYKEGLS